MKHSLQLLLGLAFAASMNSVAFAQSGSRNSVPTGNGGGAVIGGANGSAIGGGRIAGGGVGGLIPNINGGFSLPATLTRPVTAADLQRQRFQQQVLVRARLAQLARLRAEYSRRQQFEKLVRRSRLQLQSHRKSIEKERRREVELRERIAARKARALVRNRGRETSSRSKIVVMATDSNGHVVWPETIGGNPAFANHVRTIERLVREMADPSEFEPALVSLRKSVGHHARQLGSQNYISTKRFVEQLTKETAAGSSVSLAGM